jgi:hypothetical protein
MTRTSAPFPTKIGLGFYPFACAPSGIRAATNRGAARKSRARTPSRVRALLHGAGASIRSTERGPGCLDRVRLHTGLLSLHRTNFRMVRATNGAARSWRVAQAYNALKVAAVTRSTGSHVGSNPRRARRHRARIAANSTADRKLDGARGGATSIPHRGTARQLARSLHGHAARQGAWTKAAKGGLSATVLVAWLSFKGGCRGCSCCRSS